MELALVHVCNAGCDVALTPAQYHIVIVDILEERTDGRILGERTGPGGVVLLDPFLFRVGW